MLTFNPNYTILK